MARTPAATTRATQAHETRERIVDAALGLFVREGVAKTTIDQIAEAAGVSRCTVFHHFPTKEAILFDRLALPRDAVIERLRDRPAAEPALLSLHTVLRGLCDREHDVRLLDEVRAVLVKEPRPSTPPMSLGLNEFELKVIAILEARLGAGSALRARAMTYRALGWVAAAAHVYLSDRRSPPLRDCFDAAVDACLGQAAAAKLRSAGEDR